MSENATVSETVLPVGTVYDTSAQESYAAVDAEQSLEGALEEKSEVESSGTEEIQANAEETEQTEEIEQNTSEKDEFSSKFAALSRREKSLREKESKIDTKLSELEAKLAQFELASAPKEEPVVEELPLEYRLKKDPFSTLESLGLSYDKLTQLALNDGKLTPEMQLDLVKQDLDDKYSKELQDLRSEMADKEKATEEQKYQETIDNFKGQLTNFINSNEDYELIQANDSVDVVFDVIEGHYKETGRIMDTKEAADQVESYLLQEAEKLFKLNKLKSRFAPTQEPVQEIKEVKKAPTLSNNLATTSSTTKKLLTRDQSIAQAASMLKWNE